MGLSFQNVRYKTAVEYVRELGLRSVNGKSLSRVTINCRISVLKHFYDYLVRENIVMQNPFSNVSRLKDEERIRRNVLTQEETEKLLDSFDLSDIDQFTGKVICELLYGSGLRIGEISCLKITDIDYHNQTVFIKDNKENLPRKAVVCEYALNLLKLYQDHVREKTLNEHELKAGYMFHCGSRSGFKYYVNECINKQVKKLNMKRITSHCFRHSLATQMFKNGADLREVQAVLGHKKIRTTERYTRLTTDDMKKILKKAHPRERRVNNNEA